LNALIPMVRLAPKGFHHNSMNLNHIGHAHIIPRRDTLLYSFKYMCISSKLRNAHVIRFDFPHDVKTWFFKLS